MSSVKKSLTMYVFISDYPCSLLDLLRASRPNYVYESLAWRLGIV